MLSINSTKNLHADLKQNYGINFLMTSRNSTDSMENEFSVLRQMDGANVDPTCKELFTRISRRVTNVILDDKDFDIFTLRPELEKHLEDFYEWSSDLQEP